MRARDLGIVIGFGTPGPLNAITDVAGVRVGHTTLVSGEGPLVVGRGPVRTGVTVVAPRSGDASREPIFAGCHRLNRNGELTGLEWVRESGFLTSPVAITNTHSVGLVRDALVAVAMDADGSGWSLPVVGETWDGLLNDINGFHVKAEHVRQALDGAIGGRVEEGGVGGGTGMICHEFKGGIGTSSRTLAADAGGFTVGALVQANHGKRDWLRVDGVPVGREIGIDELPSPYGTARAMRAGRAAGSGSIIVVVATDAPLLPHHCERLAQRAGLGIARAGGTGGHTSGDLFIAFATGNRFPDGAGDGEGQLGYDVRATGDTVIDLLFDATIEATEEAIVNALVAATTMVGRDGITAHALPHDRLVEVMKRYGRVLVA
ncbi:MAG TPA: P1 family peptidase [Candidatus Limnocylindrales bacterium]|nr:P1 family peptidase [Candidatus Limnocylindrales bacterium]